MTQEPALQKKDEHTMEMIISKVLLFGVILATVVVVLGGALLLIQHGALRVDLERFHGEPISLSTVSGIIATAFAGRPKAIIQLGLLLLVATPITRVALSVLLFWKKKDYLYVGITAVVLLILILAISDEH